MNKKFSVFFVFLGILLSFGFIMSSYKLNTEIKVEAQQVDCNIEGDVGLKNIEFKSKSLLLIDAFTGEKVFSVNEEERYPIASMCKVMTLLLCFENLDSGNFNLDSKVVVSNNASSMGGSQVFLEENGEYTVDSLLKSIVVASANDSCVAMAEFICGSEEEFVSLMNKKASELNMNNTNFVNCTGLPKSGQYSCALDVSKMFRELIKHREYFKYSTIWTDEIEHSNNRITEISNTNKLIRFYKGCDAGKTGYTSEAGHCLVASSFRNGTRLISVAICSPDSKTRFSEVSTLFNYGFSNYESKMVVDDKKPLNIPVSVAGGKKDYVSVSADRPIFVFSKKSEKIKVEYSFTLNDKIKAPVKVDENLGTLSVFLEGKCIGTVNIKSNENIDKMTYLDNISLVLDNWGLI